MYFLMLIYWKAIQFGILEALSYVTIKRKFQTYFLVLVWCCYYVLGWLSPTMKFKNGRAPKQCIYPVLTEGKMGLWIYNIIWSLNVDFGLRAHFQNSFRGQDLSAARTFQKKGSLEFFQWQTILVKKLNPVINLGMLKGIAASWAPREPKILISSSRAVIALSLCLSVSCSAHTFVSKLKLQQEKKKTDRKKCEIK